MTAALNAARRSADEPEAAPRLSAASAEVAAGEAWVGYVEDGV